ncbi:MAG: hypothetical protein ACPG77_17610, partial [Nannocystaceae bacterium]
PEEEAPPQTQDALSSRNLRAFIRDVDDEFASVAPLQAPPPPPKKEAARLGLPDFVDPNEPEDLDDQEEVADANTSDLDDADDEIPEASESVETLLIPTGDASDDEVETTGEDLPDASVSASNLSPESLTDDEEDPDHPVLFGRSPVESFGQALFGGSQDLPDELAPPPMFAGANEEPEQAAEISYMSGILPDDEDEEKQLHENQPEYEAPHASDSGLARALADDDDDEPLQAAEPSAEHRYIDESESEPLEQGDSGVPESMETAAYRVDAYGEDEQLTSEYEDDPATATTLYRVDEDNGATAEVSETSLYIVGESAMLDVRETSRQQPGTSEEIRFAGLDEVERDSASGEDFAAVRDDDEAGFANVRDDDETASFTTVRDDDEAPSFATVRDDDDTSFAVRDDDD